MRISPFWKPVIVSLIATPICLVLGLASSGAGHGDYILATILFPFSAVLIFALDGLNSPFIVSALAILQIPAYGLILGDAATRNRFRSRASMILIVHVLAATWGLLLRSRLS